MKSASDKILSQIPSLDDVKERVIANTRGDKFIWGIVLILAISSVLVVYSATSNLAYKKNHGNVETYLIKQMFFLLIGMFIIYFLHRVNYMVYSKIAVLLFYLSIPLLLYTLIFGTTKNQGTRWLDIPILKISFQTSDFAKIALYMYLSRVLSRKQEVIKDFKKGFLPCIIPVVLTCVLIMPANLSNALLVGATSLIIMFIGRISIKHILLTLGVAGVFLGMLVMVAVLTHQSKSVVTKTNAVSEKIASKGRMGTWIKRVQDHIYASGDSTPYQIKQANLAIANGSILFGRGPGNSIARNYLPEAYNDFIFVIIIEEYGILGGAFIIFIYLGLLYRGIKVFRKCPYAFGAFLSIALSFTLVIQAMANMAVNVSLLPVTGVTLPLVSMGGTSFIFTCGAIGIILSVARHTEKIESTNTTLNPVIA